MDCRNILVNDVSNSPPRQRAFFAEIDRDVIRRAHPNLPVAAAVSPGIHRPVRGAGGDFKIGGMLTIFAQHQGQLARCGEWGRKSGYITLALERAIGGGGFSPLTEYSHLIHGRNFPVRAKSTSIRPAASPKVCTLQHRCRRRRRRRRPHPGGHRQWPHWEFRKSLAWRLECCKWCLTM